MILAEFQSHSTFFEISSAEILLLAAGGALSLILLGVFIYVFTRKEKE